MTGRLVFTYGTMAAGKSALVLQLAHQLRSCGQTVPLVTFGDRSGGGLITSRLGISADAIEMGPGDDITEAVRPVGAVAPRHLIVDEVQFATLAQVDAMAELVDTTGIDVHAFGLYADFTLTPFAASGRLVAIADEVRELPLATYCWCGQPGRCNARVIAGQMVRTGDTVAIGDLEGDAPMRYVVLCRTHYRQGNLGPQTIDISSRHEGAAGYLSNLTANVFEVRGERCESMEGFLQSLKYPDPDQAREIRQLWGGQAKSAGRLRASWVSSQSLWWQGVPMDRMSAELSALVDEAFDALFDQCPAAAEALLSTGNATLVHTIGNPDPTQTVLTEAEFCDRLTAIRTRLAGATSSGAGALPPTAAA
jgi:thymidine kinase